MADSESPALAPPRLFRVTLRGMKGIAALALSAVLIGAGVYFVARNTSVLDYIALFASDAKGRMESSTWEDDVQLRKGWPDAGVTTKTVVTNTGRRGMVMVAVTLSCSEGEWGREQKILFDPGETRTVEFFFHEPTINATNVQTMVRLVP